MKTKIISEAQKPRCLGTDLHHLVGALWPGQGAVSGDGEEACQVACSAQLPTMLSIGLLISDAGF